MPKNNPSKLAHLTMPDFKGSWWKYRESNTTTLPIGKWCPVYIKEISGKSLFKVKPSIRFESLPMVSPLYNGFTMRTKFYFVPIRLYIPELRRNKQLLWGQIPDLELPYIVLSNNYQNSETGNPNRQFVSLAGSLFDRLNIAYGELTSFQSFNNPFYIFRNVLGSRSYSMSSNLIPFLAYLDCWMYGEYNPQDRNILVHKDYITLGANRTLNRQFDPTFVDYNILRDFVDYFGGFGNLPQFGGVGISDSNVSIELSSFSGLFLSSYPIFSFIDGLTPYSFQSYLEGQVNYIWGSFKNLTSVVGLLPLTYKGDYFTSWYSEDGINVLKNYIISQGDSFLSLRKKNADFLVDVLSLVSGNRYTDYLQYIFDSNLELKDHPIMVGFDEIDFGSIDVVSQSETGDGENGVLAATASKARMYNSSVKPFSFKTLEPGILMVCSGIIPNVVYYQGVPRFMKKRHFADLWHPQYNSKGFQTISQDEYYNPFVSSRIETSDFDDSDISYGYDSTTWGLVTSYVPLGWEYMSGYDSISGGMKTTRYNTWNLRRDFTVYDTIALQVDGGDGMLDLINPLDDDNITNPVRLRSTYVDGFMYNVPFENVYGIDNDNFVVKFSFDVSHYSPITHQLITKTF